MKKARFVRTALQFRHGTRAFHQIDPGGIVGNQRIERIHHQIEHFVKVQRTTDRLCDVEQQAQFVNDRQARCRFLCCLWHELVATAS